MRFADRVEAGRRLAVELQRRSLGDAVVIGLPRGGVPVAYEVATKLGLPLDITIVRKLGVPFQPELGMGAVGENGVRILNHNVIRLAGVGSAELDAVTNRERATLERQARQFRTERAPISLAGKTAIVVDDGIATGSTARAACQAVWARGANRIVFAVPVGPPGMEETMHADTDDVVCVYHPRRFFAVGEFYRHFDQVSDERVIELLERAAARPEQILAEPVVDIGPHYRDEDVAIPVSATSLAAHIHVPEGARGMVVCANGSGSARHSSRNRHLAAALNANGLATALVDLLTTDEETDRSNVFDVRLLANRLADVTTWLRMESETAHLAVGYLGAGTSAAAALWAAAAPDSPVAAVVSRSGRPDLVNARLPMVHAPTLLIVGGADHVVVDLNRDAKAKLRCENRLEVVPGATHLFEEPGALETVASLAAEWFTAHLVPALARG